MRRGSVASVVLVAVSLLVAGCSMPAGVDRKLVDDWPQLPEAKVFVPAARVCYFYTSSVDDRAAKFPPTDCTNLHNVETVSVGAFSGADGDRDTVPPDGHPARRRAYEDCTQAANAFLGGDWRTGRLRLEAIVPKSAQWSAGARWYRCDLIELNNTSRVRQGRTNTLQGALTGNSTVGIGCVQVSVNADSTVSAVTSVECSAPHNAEFAGIFEHPDGPYPSDEEVHNQFRGGCMAVVAAYAGVPNDANLVYRTGRYYWPMFAKREWLEGNRGTRCYLIDINRTFTSSLKRVGPAGLPLN